MEVIWLPMSMQAIALTFDNSHPVYNVGIIQQLRYRNQNNVDHILEKKVKTLITRNNNFFWVSSFISMTTLSIKNVCWLIEDPIDILYSFKGTAKVKTWGFTCNFLAKLCVMRWQMIKMLVALRQVGGSIEILGVLTPHSPWMPPDVHTYFTLDVLHKCNGSLIHYISHTYITSWKPVWCLMYIIFSSHSLISGAKKLF